MGNPVVHFDISGPEPKALEEFYSTLFGWALTDTGMNYATVDTQAGHGINGGIGPTREGPPHVTIYAAVDDLKAAVDHAVRLGGSVIQEPVDIPGVVSLAMFADPWGHPIGLVGSGAGDPPPGPSAGSGLGVAWFEIMGPDGDGLAAFYRELFGWEIKGFAGATFDYREVHTNAGIGIDGGMGTPPQGPPYQTVYVSAPDVAATLARAEELGAKTIMGPAEVPGGPEVAMFLDPQGNIFGLFRATEG